MAVLSGGGNWLTLQGKKDAPAPIGSVTRGLYVSFERDVPSGNPSFPPQDVLTLEIGGEEKKIGCPAALSRIFEVNKVAPATPLKITYQGQQRNRKGNQYHAFLVETDDADIAFPPKPANDPMAATPEEIELARRLEEARARRAA